ncbi:putative CCR4-NOT transcription complex subunit 8 [Blattamonas nauphoetae]|uniref:poly(A)-specific ribonuclease n=1 Tax=Blattamonas nauphoetae TaxID=2049346 RepID=A0ABQ9XYQ2_9EUKA|nr:putative CCR4-NOT transcription complex subunit 8 [Blattamonas nauphoetae]
MPSLRPSTRDTHIIDQWIDSAGVNHAIVDVWQDNLEEEMATIQELINTYTFIAMDTEFPGEVYTTPPTTSSGFATYDKVRANVDQLKLIQLGITLTTKDNKLPQGKCSWQFNFEFDKDVDRINKESLTLLSDSGFNFDTHKREGIAPFHFAELLTISGLVLNDNITWVTFQAGYDFAYLLKMVTGRNLPIMLHDFNTHLKEWFPRVYDIRIITDRKGSLNSLAAFFNIVRHGTKHQAGSDSLLTSETYFRVAEQRFHNKREDISYLNRIAGIDDDFDHYPYAPTKFAGTKSHYATTQIPPGAGGSPNPFNPTRSMAHQQLQYGFSAPMFIPQHPIQSQQYMQMMPGQPTFGQYGYASVPPPNYANPQMPM